MGVFLDSLDLPQESQVNPFRLATSEVGFQALVSSCHKRQLNTGQIIIRFAKSKNNPRKSIESNLSGLVLIEVLSQ